MPFYEVEVPFIGVGRFRLEAKSAEEARQLVRDHRKGQYDLYTTPVEDETTWEVRKVKKDD